MEEKNIRLRFEESPWVDEIWPERFRNTSSRYFLAQWELNRMLIERPFDLRVVLPRVHVFLTRTELMTLPLWLLNSQEQRQRAARIALSKGSADADVYYELGLGALAQRQYPRAHELFTQALRASGTGPRLQTLGVYSLFMASDPRGQQDLIRELKEAGSAANLEPWVVPFLEQAIAFD
ncbi:MAG: hypothetical protein WCE62_20445, partial [Polyangiales bacterium]